MAEQLVKVRFTLDPQDWHGHGGEFLWASPTNATTGDEFEIRNSPSFATGVSFQDVVKAVPSAEERVFEFERVTKRSGHSTYMLLVTPNNAHFPAYWKLLQDKGCFYESGSINLSIGRRDLYSVDVPPTADIHEVRHVLERGELDGAWEFQDGHVHLPRK